MKSTVKVSISRSAFHLDSDAYEVLHGYLGRLEKHFEGKDGGREIVSDIEERLAELLTARISTPEQVVSIAIVEEVIGIMGMPDDMETDGTEYGAAAPASQSRRRRLYRDVHDKMIGGVCSGLAAYFGIDVVWPRLLLLLCVIGALVTGIPGGGFLFILYLALWIVVPPAVTARERVEMRNDNTTISDIQKKVEDEISALRQKWERKGKQWTPEIEREMLEAGIGARRREHGLIRLIKVCLRAVMIFFGGILLMGAVCGLLALPALLFAGTLLTDVTLFDLLDLVAIDMNVTLFKVLLSAVLLLPLLGLLYIGVKAIVGFRSRFRTGLIIFLLWLAACIMLTVSVGSSALGFRRWIEVEEEVRLPAQCTTLHVNVPESCRDVLHSEMLFKCNNDSLVLFWESDRNGAPKVYVLPNIVEVVEGTDTASIRVCFIKTASGRTRTVARLRAREIPLHYTLRDSLLLLEPFVYSKEQKWDGEIVSVKIYVPQGKHLKIDLPHGMKHKHKRIRIDLNAD
ncbi:MAG: PspC domain-containing protein [Prevotellaceae bacterium]|jgi:phage shock protein PspC (stress-responsive transcriptional regulator)|nr:PspC domain-containing protein [Prevotellaceae bacterium]